MPGKIFSRYRRADDNKPPLVLQPRDKEIIKMVYDYRLLNTDQITALTGDYKRAIQRRLQKLFHHGFLDRPQQQFTPFRSGAMIYGLGQRGAALLTEAYGIDREKINWKQRNREVGERHLKHETMIAAFRVALTVAAKSQNNMELIFWQQGSTGQLKDSVMVKGERYPIPVNPDAFFGIAHEERKLFYFLEADQSTMSHRWFLKKMKGYFNYWQQRKASERFGIKKFKVLTICKSITRADNLKNISIKADGGIGFTGFFFSYEDRYLSDDSHAVLTPIWQTPADDTMHNLLE